MLLLTTLLACYTCDQQIEDAYTEIAAAVQAHAACEDDIECVAVDLTTDCAGPCPQAVNKAGRDAVEATIAQADASYCGDYQTLCVYVEDGCDDKVAVCADGICALRDPER